MLYNLFNTPRLHKLYSGYNFGILILITLSLIFYVINRKFF